MTLVHWDDVEPEVRDVGDMRAGFRPLGRAAGATAVGVALIDIEPGCRSGPVHQHTSEEEIFFVLSGTGLAWIPKDANASTRNADGTIVQSVCAMTRRASQERFR